MVESFKKSKWTGTLLAGLIIAAVALAGLTGCSKTANADPLATVSNSPADTASPDASAKPSVSAAENAYYGQWVVNKILAYGAVGTYGKEDAEKLIGISLSFAADKASIINDQPSDKATDVKNPVYNESVISNTDFLTNFKVSFDKLGITAPSVTEVDVSVPDAGGCVLLIMDSNTMILAAGGTYFELVRAK